MVFYECVVTARNTARKFIFFAQKIPLFHIKDQSDLLTSLLDFNQLNDLVKKISHKVVSSGGIVRSVQNHGIRDLPHRFKAKFADREGNRYYKKGRFFSIYYDSNPVTQKEVDGILKMDEQVLRNTHLKARNKLWYVNIAREEKNPYIQKVIAMEKAEKGDL